MKAPCSISAEASITHVLREELEIEACSLQWPIELDGEVQEVPRGQASDPHCSSLYRRTGVTVILYSDAALNTITG